MKLITNPFFPINDPVTFALGTPSFPASRGCWVKTDGCVTRPAGCPEPGPKILLGADEDGRAVYGSLPRHFVDEIFDQWGFSPGASRYRKPAGRPISVSTQFCDSPTPWRFPSLIQTVRRCMSAAKAAVGLSFLSAKAEVQPADTKRLGQPARCSLKSIKAAMRKDFLAAGAPTLLAPLSYAHDRRFLKRVRKSISAVRGLASAGSLGVKKLADVSKSLPAPMTFLVAIHGFEDSELFLSELKRQGDIKRIVLKERTRHHVAAAQLEKNFVELDMRDGGIRDFLACLLETEGRVMLVDHGGRFARLIAQASLHPDTRCLMHTKVRGLIELSSSGVDVYEEVLSEFFEGTFPFPIVTARDAPEKDHQNKAVAHDIIERVRWALSRDGIAFPSNVAVMGCCGRVGRQIVEELCRDGVRVHGFDSRKEQYNDLNNQATQHGWDLLLPENRSDIFPDCEMVVDASGKGTAITLNDTLFMKPNCVVASITSHDTSFANACTEAIKKANDDLFDHLITLGEAPRSDLLSEATKTVTVNGLLGQPLHILTLGNAPNLSWGPSLDPAATQRYHTYVATFLEETAQTWKSVSRNGVQESREVAGLVEAGCATTVDWRGPDVEKTRERVRARLPIRFYASFDPLVGFANVSNATVQNFLEREFSKPLSLLPCVLPSVWRPASARYICPVGQSYVTLPYLLENEARPWQQWILQGGPSDPSMLVEIQGELNFIGAEHIPQSEYFSCSELIPMDMPQTEGIAIDGLACLSQGKNFIMQDIKLTQEKDQAILSKLGSLGFSETALGLNDSPVHVGIISKKSSGRAVAPFVEIHDYGACRLTASTFHGKTDVKTVDFANTPQHHKFEMSSFCKDAASFARKAECLHNLRRAT